MRRSLLVAALLALSTVAVAAPTVAWTAGYEMECEVPRHSEQGMEGEVVGSAGAPGPGALAAVGLAGLAAARWS
jgi:hypothetical protein